MHETVYDQAEAIRIVYPELRELAKRLLSTERRDHTLQPTALVHEAFLSLFGKASNDITVTPGFLALAAQQMRRILIDYGRKRSTCKRGGNYSRVEVLDTLRSDTPETDGLLILDAALEKLGRFDQRALAVVELRFFAGFTSAEAATILGLSISSVESSWQFARLWLFRELSSANLS